MTAENELRILCPFCNAPYTAKMIEELDYTIGCDTCGHGGGAYGTIEIYCENCERLVYKKEVDKR